MILIGNYFLDNIRMILDNIGKITWYSHFGSILFYSVWCVVCGVLIVLRYIRIYSTNFYILLFFLALTRELELELEQ